MCQYKADHWGKEQVNKNKNLQKERKNISTFKKKYQSSLTNWKLNSPIEQSAFQEHGCNQSLPLCPD